MAVKVFCDKCDKEVTDGMGGTFSYIEERVDMNNTNMQKVHVKMGNQLCSSCVEKVVKLIKKEDV